MDPITGIGLILALIPLFQRERDKSSRATREEFYQWLVDHRFKEVKDCLSGNFQLAVELEHLLNMNQEELLSRFDEIDQQLYSILDNMDEFRSIVKAITGGHVQPSLTKQEVSILRQFVKSGEYVLIDTAHMGQRVKWNAGSTEIIVKDDRFFNSNLRNLARLDFLEERLSGKGAFYYELTEKAVDYVGKLTDSDLSEQAQSILRQFSATGKRLLCTLRHGRGELAIMAQDIPIVVDDPRFVEDDLRSLVDKGLLAPDGDIVDGGERYTLTRKGGAFIQEGRSNEL